MPIAGTLYDETVKRGYAKLITVAPAHNVANVSFLFNNDYDTHIIDLYNVAPATDGSRLIMNLSNNNGVSWLPSGYDWANIQGYSHVATTFASGIDSPSIQISTQTYSPYGINGRVMFYKGANAVGVKYLSWRTLGYNVSGNGMAGFTGNGSYRNDGNINGVLFGMLPAVNIINATFRVYGMKRGA